MRLPLPGFVVCFCLAAPALLLAEESLLTEIDREIAAGFGSFRGKEAPTATDAEFLRRIHLDLTGMPPTAEETRRFLADHAADKRTKRIDELLAQPGYARRMAHHFDAVFLERRPDSKVPRADWEAYLRTSFAENKPYDQLTREILSADGTDPKNRAPAKFLLERRLDSAIVVRDISRIFLGKNLQCAQCHDHPNVDDYKQEHYHGLLAFFNRAYLFPNADDAKAVIAEKADGEVTFVSVFDKTKKQGMTGPKLPGLMAIAEPKLEKGKEYKVPPAKGTRPVPNFSRRDKLAATLTAPENTAFARTAANRIWAMLMGRGLVHPLDLDHSENPASHPKLLDRLAREFVAHKYDVKHLVREIVASRAYQRSSEIPTGLADPHPAQYLVAALKPLSPEQIAYAVVQATGLAESERLAMAKTFSEAAFEAKLAAQVGPFRSIYAARAGEAEEGFSVTLDQTLFLKYNGAVRNLIPPRPGNLMDRLTKQKDDTATIDELYLSVFSRLPVDEERRELADILKASTNRSTTLSETIWAMIASTEFRFNH
jgi:Protein of unknown function (DUF1549)/Protein of unknown function (DUF1553)